MCTSLDQSVFPARWFWLWFSCRRYFRVPLLILLAASPLACHNFFSRTLTIPPAPPPKLYFAFTIPPATQAIAVYDHMVQKPPCWRANYPLGHPKQKNIKLRCFILDVPVGSLLSSIAVFVPCDRKLQRAY